MVEKQELIDGLDKALSLEIGAIVQYLHHFYEIMGPFRDALAGELSSFSKAEMDHMEYISKKIMALGGDP
ncbi:MAG: ferritin-like domain-containing protein, partial [Euryarchaeota archaeon]|nr:ferritin-like domain-containing protein [Euryarchaeota archaeon]